MTPWASARANSTQSRPPSCRKARQTVAQKSESESIFAMLPGGWMGTGIHAVISPTISMLEKYYGLPLVHVKVHAPHASGWSEYYWVCHSRS